MNRFLILCLLLILATGPAWAQSVTTERIGGVAATLAIKAPVKAATTANVTLSGLQTIDGVALATGDRVLVKDQTTATANGIYQANTSSWSRALDFDGNRDVATGTMLIVTAGTVNANSYWRVSTANPITIGTSSIAFERALSSDAAGVDFLQAGTGAVSRSVQDKLRDYGLGIKDFEAECDGTTNDHASILTAVRAARAYRVASGAQSVAVTLPRGSCVIAQGLPIVTGVIYTGADRWTSRLECTGSEPCFYTATESGGVFTDSMSATYNDVATGAKESHSAGIVNLMIEHTGAISGNAPSGAAWGAVIQAIGAPSLLLQDLFIVHETNNKHAVHLKYSWHSRVVGLTVPRQSGYSGGTGIFIDSETNTVLVERPVVYGDWAACIDVSGSYAVTIQTPSIERGCEVGVLMSSGTQIVVDNAYMEGNVIDYQVGISGSSVNGWEIRRGRYFGGSVSEVMVDIVAGAHGKVDRPFVDGAYSVSQYRMTGLAADNYGNDIHINSGNAATVDLSALGLSGGRNRIWVYGDDDNGRELFRVYRSADLKPIDTFTRADIITFTSLDTTPSVKHANMFKTANAGATTITAFDDCIAGQEITIIFTDANTTVTDGGTIKLSAGFTSTADDVMKLVCDGTNAYEVSRSVN